MALRFGSRGGGGARAPVPISGDATGDRNRQRGRPNNEWLDNIKEDCSDLGITLDEAAQLIENGGYWRQCSQFSLPARNDTALVADEFGHVSSSLWGFREFHE